MRFVAGNGIYTLLMVLSLASGWLNNRRRSYESLDFLRKSAVAPPVTIIIPAWNEEDTIVETVRATLRTDYPALEIIVVDDGSTDTMLARLNRAFGLVKMDFIYRAHLRTRRVRDIYQNPQIPQLLAVNKERGSKADALNAGINLCRTP